VRSEWQDSLGDPNQGKIQNCLLGHRVLRFRLHFCHLADRLPELLDVLLGQHSLIFFEAKLARAANKIGDTFARIFTESVAIFLVATVGGEGRPPGALLRGLGCAPLPRPLPFARLSLMDFRISSRTRWTSFFLSMYVMSIR